MKHPEYQKDYQPDYQGIGAKPPVEENMSQEEPETTTVSSPSTENTGNNRSNKKKRRKKKAEKYQRNNSSYEKPQALETKDEEILAKRAKRLEELKQESQEETKPEIADIPIDMADMELPEIDIKEVSAIFDEVEMEKSEAVQVDSASEVAQAVSAPDSVSTFKSTDAWEIPDQAVVRTTTEDIGAKLKNIESIFVKTQTDEKESGITTTDVSETAGMEWFFQKNDVLKQSTAVIPSLKSQPSSMEIPSSSVEIPSSSVETPSSSVETPSSSVETPSSSVETPSSSVEIPSSSEKIQPSSVETPSSLEETGSRTIWGPDDQKEEEEKLEADLRKALDAKIAAQKAKSSTNTDQMIPEGTIAERASLAAAQEAKEEEPVPKKPQKQEKEPAKPVQRSVKRVNNSSVSAAKGFGKAPMFLVSLIAFTVCLALTYALYLQAPASALHSGGTFLYHLGESDAYIGVMPSKPGTAAVVLLAVSQIPGVLLCFGMLLFACSCLGKKEIPSVAGIKLMRIVLFALLFIVLIAGGVGITMTSFGCWKYSSGTDAKQFSYLVGVLVMICIVTAVLIFYLLKALRNTKVLIDICRLGHSKKNVSICFIICNIVFAVVCCIQISAVPAVFKGLPIASAYYIAIQVCQVIGFIALTMDFCDLWKKLHILKKEALPEGKENE